MNILPQFFDKRQKILPLCAGGYFLIRYRQFSIKVDQRGLTLIRLYGKDNHIARAVPGDKDGLSRLVAKI